jgi:hypothetical protein
VWVIELADSGLPETPVAVRVTGAVVTAALMAALSAKVWVEPIPTVAEPGATPTPAGMPVSTSVMLPEDPFTGATAIAMLVMPPGVMVAEAVWPLASESAKSGGPLLPHALKPNGRQHPMAKATELHQLLMRA